MLCLSNACILICSMAPVRQSARQRARGRPVQPSDPAAVDPPRRLATAAATGVAQRRLRATSHVQQDTTASLRKDLNEIRDLLRSVLPVAPATTPVQVAGPSVPSEPPLPPLDMPGAGSVAPPWPTTIDIQPPMASSADRRVPGTGSMGQPTSYTGTVPHISGCLRDTVGMLLQASLAPSTRLQYERAWAKLVGFFHSLALVPVLPVPIYIMMLFIAHLHNAGLAPASIISYVSAISYFHRISGHQDPAKSFIVSRLLIGAQKLRTVPDVRLPITLPILTKLVAAVPTVITSRYKQVMLRAMMVLAFKAYLRVGERVPGSARTGQNCLQRQDISLNGDLISVSFRHFKHSAKHGPQSLQIAGGLIPASPISPASCIRDFLDVRGAVQGPLFAYLDGSPMLRREFDLFLKNLIEFCGLSSKVFKGHSFRIGAATSAALRGKSDAQIRAAGRWSSDAFRKYIRVA